MLLTRQSAPVVYCLGQEAACGCGISLPRLVFATVTGVEGTQEASSAAGQGAGFCMALRFLVLSSQFLVLFKPKEGAQYYLAVYMTAG